MTPRPSLSSLTGATLIRYETADGLARNIDGDAIEHGEIAFRALAGVSGDDVEPYLYWVLRLDPARFVFDLPASMRSNGARSAGTREGFVFARGADGKANGRPVGKVIFMTHDRRFRDVDPHDRRDFERMG